MTRLDSLSSAFISRSKVLVRRKLARASSEQVLRMKALEPHMEQVRHRMERHMEQVRHKLELEHNHRKTSCS